MKPLLVVFLSEFVRATNPHRRDAQLTRITIRRQAPCRTETRETESLHVIAKLRLNLKQLSLAVKSVVPPHRQRIDFSSNLTNISPHLVPNTKYRRMPWENASSDVFRYLRWHPLWQLVYSPDRRVETSRTSRCVF